MVMMMTMMKMMLAMLNLDFGDRQYAAGDNDNDGGDDIAIANIAYGELF